MQLQARFNPLGPVVSKFTHIVPDGANGFYVAGMFGVDLVVAKFDSAGNLVNKRIWDDPTTTNVDGVVRLERDAEGWLNLTMNERIVQYSAALQPLWESSENIGHGAATCILALFALRIS